MVSRKSARSRILAAAQELAHEAGPGHISLEAVAARAGVSKGGLLYHFPSKAKLLEGVVEGFLADFDCALGDREKDLAGESNCVLRSYLDLVLTECRKKEAPPTGLLAALAENPAFLAPVKRFERNALDRIKADTADPGLAILIFLALQGLRSMQILNMQIVTPEEVAQVVDKMGSMIRPYPVAAE